ncbi:hypothetical protein U9M48_027374 [Paspalum notatum var. saurae]|uniref:Uncharacterized protein n=1 Tax=Paspalum notatum var. saurae TaxID=547442 RepID=A0AAQ3WZI3_PASNO
MFIMFAIPAMDLSEIIVIFMCFNLPQLRIKEEATALTDNSRPVFGGLHLCDFGKKLTNVTLLDSLSLLVTLIWGGYEQENNTTETDKRNLDMLLDILPNQDNAFRRKAHRWYALSQNIPMDLLIWCCSKLPQLKNPIGFSS